MPKQKSSPSILRTLLILVLLLACVAVAALAWGAQSLPRTAAKEFGTASAQLSPTQRLTYSVRLLLYREDLVQPVAQNGDTQPFEIGLGESVVSIAHRLQRQGLIRNEDAFTAYAVYAGLDTGIQAGSYEVSPDMNAMQVARAFQDATPKEVDFQILAGWRLEEIAAALPTSGLSITPEEFLYAARHPDPTLTPPSLQDLDSLEGFLFPGTYHVPRNISADQLLSQYTHSFADQISPDMRQAFKSRGLSVQEAVTLASIVQRETVVEAEAPMIASVFYNRLAQGMKLDSDPTVQYAVGYNKKQDTWWKNPLNVDDIGFDSPYNTYIYTGLPPGPISNPGLNALQAVAYPAQSPYYYFRARCDNSGRHNFSVTYEEHLQNACP